MTDSLGARSVSLPEVALEAAMSGQDRAQSRRIEETRLGEVEHDVGDAAVDEPGDLLLDRRRRVRVQLALDRDDALIPRRLGGEGEIRTYDVFVHVQRAFPLPGSSFPVGEVTLAARESARLREPALALLVGAPRGAHHI